jgi:hypothetical protein
MSEDAYTRIALRLRELSSPDREWLLGQLAADDCSRVSASLRQHRSQVDAADREPMRRPAQVASVPATGSAEELHVARLRAATVAEARSLLAGQPDWVTALVLSANSWPWTDEFLAGLTPERIRALRALTVELSPHVKPALVNVLVRVLVTRLSSVSAKVAPATLAFDSALERATREWVPDSSWKLDLS